MVLDSKSKSLYHKSLQELVCPDNIFKNSNAAIRKSIYKELDSQYFWVTLCEPISHIYDIHPRKFFWSIMVHLCRPNDFFLADNLYDYERKMKAVFDFCHHFFSTSSITLRLRPGNDEINKQILHGKQVLSWLNKSTEMH